jgi:hypothetical protein
MILLVNMTPNSLSKERSGDSEPNITVNPANPLQIAASAFTPDPMGGPNAPIYASTDGGHTWTLKSIVPSPIMTGDITQSFSGTMRALYAGILQLPQSQDSPTEQNLLRTTDFLSPAIMDTLTDTFDQDQPWAQATTVRGGPDAGKERFYVGYNDFSVQDGKTSTIGQSLDAAAANPTVEAIHIEKRTTAGFNGPQVRPVIHPDGTIYAAFYSYRAADNLGRRTADVVVVRDDRWGAGANPYTALVDTDDHLPGVRVVKSISFVFNSIIGQQRNGGDISIAVDPKNSSIVYLVFGDHQGPDYTLHVRRSTDRGVTWSSDLLVITNSVNPALAINSNSEVALLYQQITPTRVALFRNLRTGVGMSWETHLRRTLDGHAWNDLLLATTPADRPVTNGQPYLGDYINMMAVDRDFYGVFCANNTPDRTSFPNGVVYQRNANFDTRRLLANNGHSVVTPSIDPFFFKVSGLEGSVGNASPTWTAPGTPPTPPVVR